MNDKEQSNSTAMTVTPSGMTRGSSTKELDARVKPEQDNIVEIGGPKGLEPTRYGDWENNGRCWDF